MIENLKIITGSPETVAKKTQAYLDGHAKARILSSSVTMKRGQPLPEVEPVKPHLTEKEKVALEKKKAEDLKVAKAQGTVDPNAKVEDVKPPEPAEASVIEPIAASLRAIEYGPEEPFVCVIVGHAF